MIGTSGVGRCATLAAAVATLVPFAACTIGDLYAAAEAPPEPADADVASSAEATPANDGDGGAPSTAPPPCDEAKMSALQGLSILIA